MVKKQNKQAKRIPPKKKTTSKSSVSKKRESSTGKGFVVLVGTRKGGFILQSDPLRKKWTIKGPHFLGSVIHHACLDPRDRKTMLMTSRPGHIGPTIFRSQDRGRTWKEASRPPAFDSTSGVVPGRSVDHVFWLTPGRPSEPGVWYAGTSPQGLFRSTDGGDTWDGIAGLNDNPQWVHWTGGIQDQTPEGGKLHSILLDPRDKDHMYLGMSGGGFFETLDGGSSWRRFNKGCDRVFASDDPDEGHDPHCVQLHPLQPDRLYMQNHCGIYRVDRPSDTWIRIGRSMPKSIGDIGFPMTVHPRDPNTAWVFPMDGSDVWPRVSINGKPAVYRTQNAGRTWQRQDQGLPTAQAWFTVKRQAMAADDAEQVGLYFGTTSGEVWMSRNEGERWQCIAQHLPHIYAVEVVRL